jgi:Fe-S-cluster containining protein
MERNDKCFCGSGKKYKKCHSHINSESKIAEMYVYRDKYNKKVKYLGLLDLCNDNCSECCRDYFFITEFEFLLILDYLILNNKNLEDYIVMAKDSYNKINSRYSDIIQKLDENANGSNDLTYYMDNEDFIDLPNCIFLKDGECEIYDVRPDVCRAYGTTIKCRKINNEYINIKEMTEMFATSEMLQYNNRIIKPRQYPIFYWFKYFLGDEFLKLKTFNKLKVILKESKYEYAKVYEILNI